MLSTHAVHDGLARVGIGVRSAAFALVVALSAWGCSDHGTAPGGGKDHGHGHDHDHGPGGHSHDGHSHGPGDDHSHGSKTDHKTSPGDHSGVGHKHVAPHGGQVQSVGDHHFELTYDAEPGRFTLYVLAGHEGKALPIDGGEVVLQVHTAGDSEFKNLALGPDPQAGEPDGKSSRFAGSSDAARGLGDFTAVARVPVDGEAHRVSFEFAGGKPGK